MRVKPIFSDEQFNTELRSRLLSDRVGTISKVVDIRIGWISDCIIRSGGAFDTGLGISLVPGRKSIIGLRRSKNPTNAFPGS